MSYVMNEYLKNLNNDLDFYYKNRAVAEYQAIWQPAYHYPKIDKIIYNMQNSEKPATIVYWKDGTKTVVVCNGDVFTKEMGIAMAYMRKIQPNRSEFLRFVESGHVQEG